MPAVGGFVFDSSGAPVDREIRVYRRDTGALLGKTRSSGGDGGDPHFDKVMLLLYMDGADGITTFTDSSPDPKTVTAGGNAKISTAQSKFGGASAYFDGAGDYLALGDSPAWDFGTGDFAVEAFVRFASVAGIQCLITNYNGTSLGWSFQYRTDAGGLRFGHGDTVIIDVPWTPEPGVWYHVAVARSGETLSVFVDGTLLQSVTDSTNLAGSSAQLWIGSLYQQSAIQPLNGYIDDLRITKGVARYTANFTPPAARFPDFSGPSITLAFGEYYFAAPHTGEVNVVCLDDASSPLENDLILRTFPV